jgi:hypothetical protein
MAVENTDYRQYACHCKSRSGCRQARRLARFGGQSIVLGRLTGAMGDL